MMTVGISILVGVFTVLVMVPRKGMSVYKTSRIVEDIKMKCEICEDSGEIDCTVCKGSGELECHCECGRCGTEMYHDANCPSCDGEGFEWCSCLEDK